MSSTDTDNTKDTVDFTMRLPEELAVRIGVAAARERKSRAQWIREALELVVDRVEARDAG